MAHRVAHLSLWKCFILSIHAINVDVPVPSAFGLPYEELVLETPDRVKVRAYLMVQRKDLTQSDSVVLSGRGSSGMSDDEVRGSRT